MIRMGNCKAKGIFTTDLVPGKGIGVARRMRRVRACGAPLGEARAQKASHEGL